MDITNCHIHLFTLDHVPDRFLPAPVMALAKVGWIRRAISRALRRVDPFSSRDLFERYARFLTITGEKGQREVFADVRRYYPGSTRFVALPMDMSRMGRGAPAADIVAQHDELAEVARTFPGLVIPFAAIDPRRDDREAVFDHAFATLGFRGIKLYPPLGYAPSHPFLMEAVYPYCVAHGLPVTAHCSRGGVRHKDLSVDEAAALAAPDAWLPVLEAFPTLRLCLAHFGGIEDWRRYDRPDSWLRTIEAMIASGRFVNLYTDLSYTSFFLPEIVPRLNALLADPALRERVMFGSDFYMAEQANLSERTVPEKLRKAVGETLFVKLADENPQRFLGAAGAALPRLKEGVPVA
ncbi:MAG: amidohydrolase family protein [Magnetospirillum sp.]|nr:amidohydrolase family protein [Magnetospirillum sp.]